MAIRRVREPNVKQELLIVAVIFVVVLALTLAFGPH